MNSSKLVLISFPIIVAAAIGGYFYISNVPSDSPELVISASPSSSVLLTPSKINDKNKTLDILKSFLLWQIEDPTTNIIISHCTDGTRHNLTLPVVDLMFGSGGSAGSNENTGNLTQEEKIQQALVASGWIKCTPSDNNSTDYYSNTGSWYRATYIKNGKLLQFNRHKSTDDYTLQVQFEY